MSPWGYLSQQRIRFQSWLERWTLRLSSSGINSPTSRHTVCSETVAFIVTVGSPAVTSELNNIRIHWWIQYFSDRRHQPIIYFGPFPLNCTKLKRICQGYSFQASGVPLTSSRIIKMKYLQRIWTTSNEQSLIKKWSFNIFNILNIFQFIEIPCLGPHEKLLREKSYE